MCVSEKLDQKAVEYESEIQWVTFLSTRRGTFVTCTALEQQCVVVAALISKDISILKSVWFILV
jgi:hypothetical protein